jgi:hypothetical protein
MNGWDLFAGNRRGSKCSGSMEKARTSSGGNRRNCGGIKSSLFHVIFKQVEQFDLCSSLPSLWWSGGMDGLHAC